MRPSDRGCGTPREGRPGPERWASRVGVAWERSRPPRFQVSDRASPPELRRLLDERGYREDAPTEVWAPLSGVCGLRGGGWRSEHRRRGAARAVLAALGRWGERHGCRSAHLAVLRSNAPAQALHRRAGFAPVDAYAYLCAT